MKKQILAFLLLFSLVVHSQPPAVEEPIGRRFGWSMIKVIDSVLKEDDFQYLDYTIQKLPAFTLIGVAFSDTEKRHYLNYAFKDDKCVRATLILPIEEMSDVINDFDKHYTNTGRQRWRSSFGLIAVTAATGKESIRNDGKPHVLVEYDLAD